LRAQNLRVATLGQRPRLGAHRVHWTEVACSRLSVDAMRKVRRASLGSKGAPASRCAPGAMPRARPPGWYRSPQGSWPDDNTAKRPSLAPARRMGHEGARWCALAAHSASSPSHEVLWSFRGRAARGIVACVWWSLGAAISAAQSLHGDHVLAAGPGAHMLDRRPGWRRTDRYETLTKTETGVT
jgi:hypothetical protein